MTRILTGHTPNPALPERYGRTPIVIWGAKENKKSFAKFVTTMSDSIQNTRWILEGSFPQYERIWKRKPLVCQLLLSSASLGSYVFLG